MRVAKKINFNPLTFRLTFFGLVAIVSFLLFTSIAQYKDQVYTKSFNKEKDKLDVIFSKDKSINITQLWFMKNGSIRPENMSIFHNDSRKPLWPHESDTDRIIEQLMFVPPNLNEITNNGTKFKKILMYNGLVNWLPLRAGQKTFLKHKCPVSTCVATDNKSESATADAIVFQRHFYPPKHKRSPSQVYVFFTMESPLTIDLFKYVNKSYSNVFNWTATYRTDSDVVWPYGKYIPYYELKNNYNPPQRNYAFNKTGKVAWFVSNCEANNNRLNYARQLSRYIEVDIFGKCGSKTCLRIRKCFKLLDRKYKFYLAFENSNCKDYITEKFFDNGISNDVVPIVMGARKEDYLRVAPPNSFIFAGDFDTAKDLADYLKLLDKNDILYNQYFRWKETGELIKSPAYFYCRLCAMLHSVQSPKVYDNIDMWWQGPGICEKPTG